jgi:peptide/nickel transport system ATP-binding protein
LALVSHDLGVIAEICDRVIVMRNGAIVEEGPIREVARNPQHDYTRLLIGSQPGRLPQMAEPREAPVGLLELRDLQVHLPTRSGLGGKAAQPIRAVDGISLAVREGECFGIVGESGSGKSTVARAIIGLNKGTGGEIRFDGKSVSGLAGEALTRFRRAEQMVFQSPFDSLNPRMTVQRTIAEPIWRHGLAPRSVAMAKALELMDMVELPRSFAARRPGQLSGGQCQRVGIARALALSPRVLIADEVTSALDVTIQAQILRLLTRLRKERNLTILYISHDLTVVKKFCDRVAVFRHGKLVESGATADLFATPQTDYTRELIAAAPDLDAAIAKGA